MINQNIYLKRMREFSNETLSVKKLKPNNDITGCENIEYKDSKSKAFYLKDDNKKPLRECIYQNNNYTDNNNSNSKTKTKFIPKEFAHVVNHDNNKAKNKLFVVHESELNFHSNNLNITPYKKELKISRYESNFNYLSKNIDDIVYGLNKNIVDLNEACHIKEKFKKRLESTLNSIKGLNRGFSKLVGESLDMRNNSGINNEGNLNVIIKVTNIEETEEIYKAKSENLKKLYQTNEIEIVNLNKEIENTKAIIANSIYDDELQLILEHRFKFSQEVIQNVLIKKHNNEEKESTSINNNININNPDSLNILFDKSNSKSKQGSIQGSKHKSINIDTSKTKNNSMNKDNKDNMNKESKDNNHIANISKSKLESINTDNINNNILVLPESSNSNNTENNKISIKGKCCICLKNEANCLFIQCGNLITCMECSLETLHQKDNK